MDRLSSSQPGSWSRRLSGKPEIRRPLKKLAVLPPLWASSSFLFYWPSERSSGASSHHDSSTNTSISSTTSSRSSSSKTSSSTFITLFLVLCNITYISRFAFRLHKRPQSSRSIFISCAPSLHFPVSLNHRFHKREKIGPTTISLAEKQWDKSLSIPPKSIG